MQNGQKRMYFRDQFLAQQKRFTDFDTNIKNLLIFPGGTGGNFLTSHKNNKHNLKSANEYKSSEQIGDAVALGWPYYKPGKLSQEKYLELAQLQCVNWKTATQTQADLYCSHNYPLFLFCETNSTLENLYILKVDLQGTHRIVDLLLYYKRMFGRQTNTVLDLVSLTRRVSKHTFQDSINDARWQHIQHKFFYVAMREFKRHSNLIDCDLTEIYHYPWPIISNFVIYLMANDLDDISNHDMYQKFKQFVVSEFETNNKYKRGQDIFTFGTLYKTCFIEDNLPGVQNIHVLDYKDIFIDMNPKWCEFFCMDPKTIKQYSLVNLKQVLFLLEFTTDRFQAKYKPLVEDYILTIQKRHL